MLLIGIAGGSGSGKTTVVRRIMQMLPPDSVSILSQDNYYRDNGHLSAEERKQINFDHPSSIEFSLMVKQLDDLKAGKTIQMPTYSYLTCARLPETIAIAARNVIIVEGILIMTDPDLRDRLNIKVFVDADADDRLMRIMRRDLVERGRTNEEVLKHYETYVKPMHLQFIEPTKRYADIIVPQGGENSVAIDVLASRIHMRLASDPAF